jgi:tetratricopeptide (TPR) repeat protein
MCPSGGSETSRVLQSKRVAFVGKLASMSKRAAGRLAREHGAVVIDKPGPSVDLIVVGEEGCPPLAAMDQDEWFGPSVQEAIEHNTMELITETQLWQRIGLVEAEQEIHRLYTPAMLAELAGVDLAVIRRWHRRGLIQPVREVRKLAYFDFQDVATAKGLAKLLASGISPTAIERKLQGLRRFLPGVERPLAQLSVIVQGKEILLRQGDGLVEPGGQLRFDFQATGFDAAPGEPWPADEPDSRPVVSFLDRSGPADPARSPRELCRMAETLEEAGDLAGAAEMYRAAMAAGGPSAEICFRVAELLYRLGELGGARERYYMAIELDEDYVEARANLGCVLAEGGQFDLALAAFGGALACHPDYADVHYHMARLLEELGRAGEASGHWRAFLDLAPDSPWADEARGRLAPPPS